MYARAVDDAAARIHDLRHEEWGDFALGLLAIGIALAATQVAPQLAVPFFVGGMFLVVRGMTALVRREELIDELVMDPDAYVIAEVRARALRETTPQRRRALASHARAWLGDPPDARLAEAADELVMLVAELEDEALELDPAPAAACARLLLDPLASPLFNPSASPEEIRSRVVGIRAGFRPGSAPSAVARPPASPGR